MSAVFQRPKGAQSDLKELEYISALHQSQVSKIRCNGTISTDDIQLFMRSRYAIHVSQDESLDILRGLGGACSLNNSAAAAHAASSTVSGVNDAGSSNGHEKDEKDQDNDHRRSTNSQEKVSSLIISPATSLDSFYDNHNQRQQKSQQNSTNNNDKKEEDEKEYLDLVQLTSIIFIPTILKACHDVISLRTNHIDIHHEMEKSIKYAQEQITSITYRQSLLERIKHPMEHYKLRKKRSEWKRKVKDIKHAQDHQVKPRWIVKDVLRILLASVLDENESQRCSDSNQNSSYTEHRQREESEEGGGDISPPLYSPSYKLTIESLQTLLQAHEEYEIAKNIPLLKSMIAACSPSQENEIDENTEIILNEVSFAHALSNDLHLWNIGCEDDLTTTTYHDVFHKDHVDDFDKTDFNFPHFGVDGDDGGDGIRLGMNGKKLGEKIKDGMNEIRKRENEGGEMRRSGSDGSSTGSHRIDVEAPSEHNEDDNTDKKAGEEDIVVDAVPNNAQKETLSQSLTSMPPLEAFVSCKDVHVSEENEDNHSDGNNENVEVAVASSKTTTKEPRHIKSAPYIDYVVDTYRSLLFLMSLWVFYLFSVIIFVGILGSFEYDIENCDTSTFSCNLAMDLFVWVTLAIILSVFGFIIIVPVSFANDPSKKSPTTVAFSFILLVVYTVCPYIFLTKYRERIPESNDEPLSDLETFAQSDTVLLAITLYLAYGCILMLKVVLLFVNTVVRYESIVKKKMHWYMLPSHFTSTANIKLAGTHKVNEFLQNAIKMHHVSPIEERNNEHAFLHHHRHMNAMNAFIFNEEHHERCGGFVWTWRRILTRDLARKDGIWLHSRLAIGQEVQTITLVFYIILLFWGADKLAQESQNSRDRVIADESLSDEWKDWALNIIPESWMIYASFIPGGLIAFTSGILLILVYVPSTVTTVFKLRSGIIPTLTNEKFNSYRSSADSIFYNIGNMVYAMVGSVAFMFVIFGGIIFLFVWPVTRDFMMLVLSWGLGLCITILVKTILLMLCRANFQSAFFRRYPRRANFSALAMECWNIGIGGGVMIGRLTQFLLASAFWIGRIDVTFLDENVNLFGYNFDEVPIGYRKEILVHEAHRHPFMERLGVMYLMRLKHGKNFSCDAGACWRILFVKGLMPWLEKYRRLHTNEDDTGNPLASSVHSIKPYSARLTYQRR